MERECKCHSGKMYRECCQKFHDGEIPETAAQLMRSRYSAYAMGLVEYIIKTTHKKNSSFNLNKEQWKKEILHFSKNVSFDGLEIVEFLDGEKEAFVTFKATLKQQNQDISFTEKSRFLKEKDRWLYVDGQFVTI